MVVYRFEQGDLKRVARIKNAERAVAETGWTVGAYVRKGRHQVTCARTGHLPRLGHKIKIADRLHEPGIGLLLRRYNKRPIGRIGYVLE